MALAVGPVVRGDPGFQRLRTGYLSSVGTIRHPHTGLCRCFHPLPAGAVREVLRIIYQCQRALQQDAATRLAGFLADSAPIGGGEVGAFSGCAALSAAACSWNLAGTPGGVKWAILSAVGVLLSYPASGRRGLLIYEQRLQRQAATRPR